VCVYTNIHCVHIPGAVLEILLEYSILNLVHGCRRKVNFVLCVHTAVCPRGLVRARTTCD
jgi:hypothetical protein